MRRYSWMAAAALLAAGLSGCDQDGSGQNGGLTTPVNWGSAADSKPKADELPAPLKYSGASGGAAAGEGEDPGRVTFDGAKKGGGSGGVAGGSGVWKSPSGVRYTAAPRKEGLVMIAPPAPSDATYRPDFTRVAFDEERGDADARRSILDKARNLMHIKYVMGADSMREMDCSAWVSRVWGVSRHTTASFLEVGYKIPKDDLLPGDALLLDIKKSNTGYGHIRLFVGWASEDHSQMWVCDESPAAGSSCKKTSYSNAYQPIRRRDLPPGGPGQATLMAANDQPTAGASGAAAPDCRRLGSVGCLYAPAAARNAPVRTLLVFLRGHYGSYQGSVPASLTLKAAQDAFGDRGLGAAGDSLQAAVLVTGSSHLAVSGSDIAAAEKAFGVPFDRIVLAAHSGGYVGLQSTLAQPSFPAKKLTRVVMLDDFYSEANKADLARLTARGVSCSGFYTEQSDAYSSRALGYGDVCALEKGADHSGDVNACLAAYASGRGCSRKTVLASN